MAHSQKPFFQKLKDYFSPQEETEEEKRKRLERERQIPSDSSERQKVSESFKKVF